MPILPNNTLSSIVNLVNRANSDPVVQPPLSNAAFTLDSSGVAGFFGGESAVRAMGTAYLIPKRRWLGWYNAPGAYEVAKQYSGLAKSHLFNALFPGDDRDPAKILMVDGQVGPECTPLYFPTQKAPSSIGHLGSLIARKVSQMPVKKVLLLPKKNSVDTCRVTFVKLNRILTDELNELDLVPSSSIIFTVFTILISFGGCVACALVGDWFCFSSILLGIIANGIACSVIGSGRLYLKNNPSAQTGSPGDILLRSDTSIIVLVGGEGMQRPFTHGRFVLRFGEIPWFGPEQAEAFGPTMENGDFKENTPKANPLIPMVEAWFQRILQKCLTVDISVILLLFQFLAQLLLIPQGTLFGQLMFIGTLVPSWMYHSYLSTLGLDLQTRALFDILSIQKNKDIFPYQLSTWTQATVFACLVFRSIHPPVSLSSTTNAGDPTLEDILAAAMAKQEAEDKEKNLRDARKRKLRAMKKALEAKGKADAKAADMARAAMEAENDANNAENEVDVARVEVDQAEVKVEEAKEKPEETKAAALLKEKQEEVDMKQSKATRKMVEKSRKDRALKVAQNAAEAAATDAQEAVDAVKEEELRKMGEDQEEAQKKQDDDRAAQKKEKEDNALKALLNALLPGQTEILQAFKESLVRKLSSANSDADWANMEREGSFKFDDKQDRYFSIQDGKSFRLLERSHWPQLDTYRLDAEKAFTAWKSIGKIPL